MKRRERACLILDKEWLDRAWESRLIFNEWLFLRDEYDRVG